MLSVNVLYSLKKNIKEYFVYLKLALTENQVI